MKKQVKNILEELGFQPESVDEYLGFEYEGMHYLYLYNPNDEDFLNFSIPCVMAPDDEDESMLLRIEDQINSKVKYVKAYIWDDRLWLFYERELFGGENMEELITAIIFRLAAAAAFMHELIDGPDEEKPSSDSTEDDSDDSQHNGNNLMDE